MQDYIAVIQAGGKGKRMYSFTKNKIPKPMLLMNDKPILQWQIEKVSLYGILDIVIIVGHMGNKIKEYFGNGENWNIHITYIEEDIPLGSAGALYELNKIYPDKNFFLIYGDVFFDIDWNRMIAFHERHKAIATLLVHPNSHPYDSDLIVLAEDDRVIEIDSKQKEKTYWYDNLVNSGIYIFNKKILEKFSRLENKDLEKDIISPLLKEKKFTVIGHQNMLKIQVHQNVL